MSRYLKTDGQSQVPVVCEKEDGLWEEKGTKAIMKYLKLKVSELIVLTHISYEIELSQSMHLSCCSQIFRIGLQLARGIFLLISLM